MEKFIIRAIRTLAVLCFVIGALCIVIGVFLLFIPFGDSASASDISGCIVAGIIIMLYAIILYGISYMIEAACLYLEKNKEKKQLPPKAEETSSEAGEQDAQAEHIRDRKKAEEEETENED